MMSGAVLYKYLHHNVLCNEQTLAVKNRHVCIAHFSDLGVWFNRDPGKSQSKNREENNRQGNWTPDHDVKCFSQIRSNAVCSVDR